MAGPNHPAKYTDILLPIFVRMLRGHRRILDPFAGTGKIFLLKHWLPDVQITAVEIEFEWASQSHSVCGDALHLPFADNSFDAICTSPAYGNRMADTLLDKYTRHTYTCALGHKLHTHNSGAMQWSNAYRQMHQRAWLECRRTLCTGGVLVLNCKNHIRSGAIQYVTEWHMDTLQQLGFTVIEHVKVPCPGMRYGQNYSQRVDQESVVLFTNTGTIADN